MSGPFVDSTPLRSLGNVPLTAPGRVGLVPVDVYKVGEPMFVQLVDRDANRDRGRARDGGDHAGGGRLRDTEILRLTETEPDSATFVGYIQSTGRAELATTTASSGWRTR
ncbi:MAG: hypothetical protein U5R48_08055 [Gammaproteobacteria bacterium]|nr:hypothetical protein [Gammaproteobacteria bacterium]